MFNHRQKIVVFTGAGVSAESGIKTFRDSDGLWENFKIEEVATPQAWRANPALVLEFYNQRRIQVMNAKPNAAHLAIAELESYFDVQVITQNIDDLHERAGSKNVLHLHGEIMKARSEQDAARIIKLQNPALKMGDLASDGAQLRPHIVWFGEEVPNMEMAYMMTEKADIFIVIGTSLNVYPAANLAYYAPEASKKFVIDPKADAFGLNVDYTVITSTACQGMPGLVQQLIQQLK
jgi:NAD-dependent deacetylase